MTKSEEIKTLEDRLRNVILSTCNTIGCDSCGLSWKENGKEKCSATELNGKIYDLKFNEASND